MSDNEVKTSHMEGAKALIEKIRALHSEVPNFVIATPAEAKRLATVAGLDDAFLESAGVCVQTTPGIEDAAGAKLDAMRDRYGFALAYEAAVPEAFAFARSLAHTCRVARAEAGGNALDIYAFARRRAKRKNGAELVPHVEDMRRKLKRGRRKATSEPAPAPAATHDAVK